jgi:hypothetical protein
LLQANEPLPFSTAISLFRQNIFFRTAEPQNKEPQNIEVKNFVLFFSITLGARISVQTSHLLMYPFFFGVYPNWSFAIFASPWIPE